MGCGDSTASASGAEASTGADIETDSTSSGEGSSGTGSSSSTDATTEPSTDTSSSGTDPDTDTDTDTDTDGALELCDPDVFDVPSVASISDPFCNGGDRCTATATCTVSGIEPPSVDRDFWEHTLSCDGQWADELDPPRDEVGVEVRVVSDRELAFGDQPLGYVMETDYADRFDGQDYTFNELSIDGERVAVDITSDGAIGIEGLSTVTLESEPCDPRDVTWISYECAWPRGLVGEDAQGDPISAINAQVTVGSWLIASEGWERCGNFPPAYNRRLKVSAVRTDLLPR